MLKKVIKSKTIQIALLQAIIGIVVIFQTEFNTIGGFAIAKSVLDMVLRSVTTKPLSDK